MRNLLLDALPEFQPDMGETITREYQFELITPMFGGDSQSWELNPEAPVRAQSIRGQLRFWWRTMQGDTDPVALLDRENALWGGRTVSKSGDACRIQSRVKVAVTEQEFAQPYHARLNDKGNMLQDEVIPVYVAFPVSDAIKNHGREVLYFQKLSFSLTLSFPQNDEKVVLNTLKLWTLFGGVGARTRRGCGSLYCEKLLNDFGTEKDIWQFVARCASGPSTAFEYARLSSAVLACSPPSENTESSWLSLVKRYAEFRQDRVPRSPKPGRSYWPEPDAIRVVTGQHSPQHSPSHPDEVWFPRAAFGLPIITKFNTRDNGQGDPDPQVQLQPAGHERWPSPVILKVIPLADGRVLKAALVLNQRFPNGLELTQQNRGTHRLPETAAPFARQEFTLKTKPGFTPEATLYKNLFKALNLKEVQ